MKSDIAGKLSQLFINSKLTPLLILAFLAVGIYFAYLTPREEEPQINVPIADLFVQYPGANPKEVEKRVAEPLEKIIMNIEGVEYVYSTSMNETAMLIVRYEVGRNTEEALVRLYNELMRNMDKFPSNVSMPFIKSKSINDVPILAFTLWSEKYNDFELKRIAEEFQLELEKIENVADTEIKGGRSREIRIELNKEKMQSYSVDPLALLQTLQASNVQSSAGSFSRNDQEFLVETGSFFETKEDIANLVIGVHGGSPVYLKNVAEIIDGPEEPGEYVSFGIGSGTRNSEVMTGEKFPAVTVSVSKKEGSDAMEIADKAIKKTEELKGILIPGEVTVDISRNYGETASHKVIELLEHLLGAILAVTIIVAISMGWRGGLVVFASVPITFALTLFVYYMFDYTLNRITLFALVFVTGIVVDDSIIIAENMHRHFKMKRLPFLQAAIHSINEVGNPTILATFTVIAAVLPMAFVSGLMGPYMSPMPIGASLAMIFSLIVALVITPWLAYRLLKNDPKNKEGEKKYQLENTLIYRAYRATIQPALNHAVYRWLFIGATVIMLLGSMSLVYFQFVEVKMLPFDNKNEFQIIIDMPEGTTLERTNAVANELAAYIRTQPEVVDYQIYSGTSAPINFNGLVRHYDLRKGSNMADIQVNLLDKSERDEQSHDIAKRVRPHLQKIGDKFNANVKVVEVPPGPPVLSTLVAEIYGPSYVEQIETAEKIKKLFSGTEGVVDVDWMIEDDQTEYKFDVDKEKAMLAGVTTEQVVKVLSVSLNGMHASRIYQPKESEQVSIFVILPIEERSSVEDLKSISVQSRNGSMIPVSELVTIKKQIQDKSIYRKNMQRVVYVTADVAGKIESPIYAILDLEDDIEELNNSGEASIKTLFTTQPFLEEDISLKWDGEWHITYEVFRDLGTAFAVVLVIIYMLIIAWFQSFKVPVVMMIAIPLSLVGILVGHLIFDAFFTATSMIGMIALAGIMVRNSILLIDFIELRLKDGVPIKQAVIEAGAVRTTPILLTAGTVIIGAFVILFDPIFQGLAISLMGGSIASTGLTLLMVPLIYYMTEKKKYEDRNN